MVSNEEISIMLESKRRGLNPDELTRNGIDPEEILQIMQIPYKWTGNGYLFDFDSMPIEELSNYINYIFKQLGYRLDEGTPINGIYFSMHPKSTLGDPGLNAMGAPVYKFKVEIYPNGGKTYLEISRLFRGWYMSLNKIIYGKNYLNSALNNIVDKIKYLKPSVIGYLICNKCGSYYELQEGESPEDFDKTCECGGTFEYIANINQPDKEPVEKSITTNTKQYLNVIIIVILLCLLFSFLFIGNSFKWVIFMPLFVLLLVLISIRSDY